MTKKVPIKAPHYAELLREVKDRIQRAQARAILVVNAELVRLYWDIGRFLDKQQSREGWGSAVIPRLACDLHNELPELKGFSERNIGRMIAFFRAYPRPGDFLPQAVAKSGIEKLPQAVAKIERTAESMLWLIPWGHHAVLLEKVKSLDDRLWYMRQTLQHGWSRYPRLVAEDEDRGSDGGARKPEFAGRYVGQEGSDGRRRTIRNHRPATASARL